MSSPLDPQLKHLIDSMPGYWVCKDLQSTYFYANQQEAQLIGLRHQEEAAGLTDLDIPCGAAESAPLFQAQDREVVHSGQTLRILDIHRYSGNTWRSLLTSKMPLRDEAQNIVGVIAQMQEVDPFELLELASLLDKRADYILGPSGPFSASLSCTIGHSPVGGPALSPRQENILFLLVHGCSAQQISQALDITQRSVEKQQRLLQEIFAAASLSELIDRADQLGYRHNIPLNLAQELLWSILPED